MFLNIDIFISLNFHAGAYTYSSFIMWGEGFYRGGGLLFRLKVCPILCVAVIIEVHWCLCNEVSCNQSGIHVT